MTNYSAFIKKVFPSVNKLEGCLIVLSFALIILATPSITFAQKTEKIPDGVVPPPLNIISKDAKKQLNAQTKPKKRTKLALVFMNARLLKSQKLIEGKEFEKSLNQLGKFKAILQNTLQFLKKNEKRRGSFKNFKRFEITLRRFLPKLELVRRKMPFRYGYHVSQLIKTVRKARSAAIDPLFDDTVIPQGNR